MPLTGPDILLYEKKDRIVTITLNRPERLNALSLELEERLAEAWERFRDDDDAWVAIVTGSGDKAFCVGFDLKDQAERDRAGVEIPDVANRPSIRPETWKPIIAAINGYVVGGGFSLAQACDIRIAAEHIEFGITETQWNAPVPFAYELTRTLHLGHALEIALWGDRRISAQRGYEIGWINEVVSKEQLMDRAMEWASRMLDLAPRSVRNIKEIIYRGFHLSPSDGAAYAAALETNLHGMEDSIEGARAFKEHRKPQFKNR